MIATIRRNMRLFFLASGALAAAFSLAGTRHGHAAEAIDWQTGPDFQRELNNSIGVSWEGKFSVRRALERIGHRHRVAIVLDRRVDPNREVLCANDAKLEIALYAIAEQLELGMCVIEPVVYIGPKKATSSLVTLTALRKEELLKLDEAVKRRLMRTSPMQWDKLAVPRELVDQLSHEAGLKISGVETIPHDLWPAGSLPPLGLIDRLTILLAGFDLAFEFSADGQSLQLIVLPTDLAIERSYSVPRDQTRVVRLLTERFPTAEIRPDGAKIVVVASLEDHQAIRDQLAGTTPRPPLPKVTTINVYELKVENKEVGAVIDFLAGKFEMTAEFDESAKDKLKKLTSFDVKEATLEDLFKAAVTPAGLSCRIDGKKVVVFAPK